MPATASIMPAPRTIAALPQIVELNIGHFLIGEAVFDGLRQRDPHHARARWIAAAVESAMLA